MKSKLTNFSVCRSIEVNPAYLFNQYPDGRMVPVQVSMASVLGTQSSYNAKLENAVSGNPQRVEVAYLNPDCDTLSIQFTARINGREGLAIEMINLPDLEGHLIGLSELYEQAGGFEFLGALYAANIADGKHAWRNRFGSKLTTTVEVSQPDTGVEKTFTFQGGSTSRIDPRNPKRPVAVEQADVGTERDFIALGKLIGEGLSGKHLLLMKIRTDCVIGDGQEVYPSQEMVETSDKRAPSRIYYKDPETSQAMMHSQKISNAIRHIDIWHPQVDRFGAIAVEPFGSIVRRQAATRFGNQRDFYTLLAGEEEAVAKQKPSRLGQSLKEAQNIDDLHAITDVHYFFAILMRGGVLGMAKSKKEES